MSCGNERRGPGRTFAQAVPGRAKPQQVGLGLRPNPVSSHCAWQYVGHGGGRGNGPGPEARYRDGRAHRHMGKAEPFATNC